MKISARRASAAPGDRPALPGTCVPSLTSGIVLDQFAAGIRHDVELGPEFRGAPIITISGKVIGVASTAYDPLDIRPDEVLFAPPVNSACEALIASSTSIRSSSSR